MFAQKFLSDSTLEWYKVHLVAKSYLQCSSYDFLETFAFTVHMTLICVVLALTVLEDLNLCSVDISHAYIIQLEKEEDILSDNESEDGSFNEFDMDKLFKQKSNHIQLDAENLINQTHSLSRD